MLKSITWNLEEKFRFVLLYLSVYKSNPCTSQPPIFKVKNQIFHHLIQQRSLSLTWHQDLRLSVIWISPDHKNHLNFLDLCFLGSSLWNEFLNCPWQRGKLPFKSKYGSSLGTFAFCSCTLHLHLQRESKPQILQ